MSNEKKKFISSELEDLLKEVEKEHQQTRSIQNKKNQNKKKKSKIRIDMIIAAVLAIVIIAGVISLIVHFTGKAPKDTENQTMENPLQEEKYPEISDVMKNYLNAFLIEDDEKRAQVLAQYVGNMYDINTVKKNEYVAAYSDIECYTKEGPYDNTYVVYVYYQMELKNISTPAPCVGRFYVVRDANTGNVYIQNDAGDEIQKYMNEVQKDSDVQDLLKSVETEFAEAKESDSDLKAYFDKINEALQKNKETTAEASTAQATEAATKAVETTAAPSKKK